MEPLVVKTLLHSATHSSIHLMYAEYDNGLLGSSDGSVTIKSTDSLGIFFNPTNASDLNKPSLNFSLK